MKTNQAIALAACKFELGNVENNQIWIQMTPTGHFKAIDGRPKGLDSWYIDAATAQNVIDAFNQRKNDAVVDYEHQTLHKEQNGQKAPAAAWLTRYEWREGKGLFGLADLTQEGAEDIAAKKYRYFSPVFTYDKATGVVTDVVMGAFTNYAGVDGMEPLAQLAAETFLNQQTPEVTTMDLKKLLEALGLAENATLEDVLAAIKALQEVKENKADEAVAAATAKISKALGMDEKSTPDALVAACTALTIAAKAKKSTVDPAQYVPIEAFTDLQKEVAALSTETKTDKVRTLVKQAIDDCKLLPSLEDWALELGETNMAALTAFINKSPTIAALTGTQTGGKEPANPDYFNLTKTELEVAALTGLSPKEFAEAKKAQEQN